MRLISALKRAVLGVVVVVTLSGCCIPLSSSEDTRRHLIIGVGLVSINDNAPHAAVATSIKSFGASVSNQPGLIASLGYASSKVVSVAEGASVVVDVSHSNRGGLIVDVVNYKENKK